MTRMAVMLVERRHQTRFCEALEDNGGASDREQFERVAMGTPPGAWAGSIGCDVAIDRLHVKNWKATGTSGRAAVCRRWNRPIRKKIIGRGMRALQRWPGGGCDFLHGRRTFPLFHQPAGEHGRGVFLHPLIEQRSHLLAEIRSMAEAREFIALQRIARGREKELPRGLGPVVIHMGLLGNCAGKLTVR